MRCPVGDAKRATISRVVGTPEVFSTVVDVALAPMLQRWAERLLTRDSTRGMEAECRGYDRHEFAREGTRICGLPQ